MQYNFDEYIDRRGTNSAKFDEQDEKYGCKDMIHLGVADMDFRSPEPIIEAMRRIVEKGVFGYTVLPGRYESLVCNWMESRYGVRAEPDWVVFSPRINMAMNMAVETFTGPEDGIVLHTPAYTALWDAVIKYGRTLIESPLVLERERGEGGGGKEEAVPRYRMEFEDLRKRLKKAQEQKRPAKMLLFCNPQNPTGRVWTRQELSEVVKLCNEFGLLLISDEIHSDFIRPGFTFTSMLSFAGELTNGLIVCNSVTKTFNVPGVILSNMIIPDRAVREAMKRTADRWGIHNPNIFAAGILEAAYTECAGWIGQINEYIEKNRRFVTEYLEAHLPGLQVIPSEGTYLLWVSTEGLCRSPEEIEEFFDRRAKVSVYMGGRYGRRTEQFIRINLAAPCGVLEEALGRIGREYGAWLAEGPGKLTLRL